LNLKPSRFTKKTAGGQMPLRFSKSGEKISRGLREAFVRREISVVMRRRGHQNNAREK
jgi:hypothetical protein